MKNFEQFMKTLLTSASDSLGLSAVSPSHERHFLTNFPINELPLYRATLDNFNFEEFYGDKLSMSIVSMATDVYGNELKGYCSLWVNFDPDVDPKIKAINKELKKKFKELDEMAERMLMEQASTDPMAEDMLFNLRMHKKMRAAEESEFSGRNPNFHYEMGPFWRDFEATKVLFESGKLHRYEDPTEGEKLSTDADAQHNGIAPSSDLIKKSPRFKK